MLASPAGHFPPHHQRLVVNRILMLIVLCSASQTRLCVRAVQEQHTPVAPASKSRSILKGPSPGRQLRSRDSLPFTSPIRTTAEGLCPPFLPNCFHTLTDCCLSLNAADGTGSYVTPRPRTGVSAVSNQSPEAGERSLLSTRLLDAGPATIPVLRLARGVYPPLLNRFARNLGSPTIFANIPVRACARVMHCEPFVCVIRVIHHRRTCECQTASGTCIPLKPPSSCWTRRVWASRGCLVCRTGTCPPSPTLAVCSPKHPSLWSSSRATVRCLVCLLCHAPNGV